MKTSGNTILISGGGSGIGRELAHAFHRLGNKVIVAGRRAQALDETAADYPGISKYLLDVTDSLSIRNVVATIISEHPNLNVLVNNAGIMRKEELAGRASDGKDAEESIATNLLGPIRLTNALLPHLRSQAASTVINVTSGLAFVPLVATPTYCATKAALHSYTVSLRQQLRDTSIEVIELIPPGVQTDLMPGHAANPVMMPLKAFIDEVMDLFVQQPTPQELCVKRVEFQRYAEAQGRFDNVLDMLNSSVATKGKPQHVVAP
jgi:uncharacterized oxidoreductase